MTAAPVGWTPGPGRVRVATKFTGIARRFFAEQGRQADFIKLYGAMELAPLMGLADVIVDIVDTGNKLKANGLEPRDLIADISPRLVVNKASMRSQHAAIEALIADLREVVA
jgi:ATP phosphoribosyltransferase